jgi:glycogen synthase
VTVIELGRGRQPGVEFRDGMWVHGIVPPPALASWRAAWSALSSPRARFAAAVADEVERIQPRRQFQILAGPPSMVAAIERLDRVGLPTVATTITPLEAHMLRTVADG